METNEQGLTKEEKVMFSILGIILAIAVGVLIINTFTSKDRQLKDNETPITENKEQKNNIEDEVTTDDSEKVLIEELPEEYDIEMNENSIINVNSNQSPSKKPSNSENKNEDIQLEDEVNQTQPEDSENGIGSTGPTVISWSIKDTVITQAYNNDLIKIEKNILLENEKEQEASVIVKKQEGDNYNIIDISTGEFVATTGVYIYYYTYADITKELTLVVKDYIVPENIEILNLQEQYNQSFAITEEEFNNLKEITNNSTLVKESEQFNLTINKNDDNLTLIPLVLTFNNDIPDSTIVSSTNEGVEIVKTNEAWHQKLTNQNIILWLDLSLVDINNEILNIKVDDKEYQLTLKISIINNEENLENESNSENKVEEKEDLTTSDKQVENQVTEEQKENDNEYEESITNIENTLENLNDESNDVIMETENNSNS